MLVSEFRVLCSAAGYYVGRSIWDVGSQCWVPHSCESDYFEDLAVAGKILRKTIRVHCGLSEKDAVLSYTWDVAHHIDHNSTVAAALCLSELWDEEDRLRREFESARPAPVPNFDEYGNDLDDIPF